MRTVFQLKFSYCLGFMIVGVLFGFWVVNLESRIAKDGFELAKIQKEQELLLAEKKKLEIELAMVSTPGHIMDQLAGNRIDVRPVENVNALALWRNDIFGRERFVPRALAEYYSSRSGGR